MKIVVDICGGDHAPEEIIKGCVEAINKHKGFEIVMVGKQDEIKQLLCKQSVNLGRIEIVDAQDIITNDDVPTTAIKTKKDSSLVVALSRLKDDDECVGLVSAGSTGAVLTGAFLKIGRIKGVLRPALAPSLPTVNGGHVVLLDCGANVDCKPHMLQQFALMGSAYSYAVHGVKKPRIGLLSNGTEDKKGNDLTREAFALLKSTPEINFAGNMEAREILSGDYDVVVCDGFNGNIALKSCEGTANAMLKLIKQEISKGLFRKVGALMLKKSFSNIRDKMDYNRHGGAPFIGVNKIVVKSHGSSKASPICGSIMQVYDYHNSNLISNITRAMSTLKAEE